MAKPAAAGTAEADVVFVTASNTESPAAAGKHMPATRKRSVSDEALTSPEQRSRRESFGGIAAAAMVCALL